MLQRDSNRRIAVCAALIAFGSALWVFEEFLPRPLPWLKPGLANIASLIALQIAGPWEAILVGIGRVIVGSLVMGSIGSAGFFISISATAVSSALMALLHRSRLSIYGISISGALAHSITQLLVVSFLIYSPKIATNALPLVTLPAMPTGILVALISKFAIERVPRASGAYTRGGAPKENPPH